MGPGGWGDKGFGQMGNRGTWGQKERGMWDRVMGGRGWESGCRGGDVGAGGGVTGDIRVPGR